MADAATDDRAPTGCGHEGRYFGAVYPDGVCCDGHMWDLDSCDEPGGSLSSGGDLPCPSCNTRAYLAYVLQDIRDDICEPGFPTPAARWETLLKSMFDRFGAQTVLALGEIELESLPDIDPNDIAYDKTWPWRIDGVSAHAWAQAVKAMKQPSEEIPSGA